MAREVVAGGITGWVAGAGPRVLLLHGGPGLGHDYLADLVDELAADHEVATYQQRGLPPSRVEGPFTVADHVADAARVLDALGWDDAVVAGHSWGGHLALHVAVALPARTRAVLAVDPLGGVGDGGSALFNAEMAARTPPADLRRAEELDALVDRGEGSEADAEESLRLVWPAYFADREQAPPMPPTRLSSACFTETLASMGEELPGLERALPTIACPVGFVVGAASPVPTSASTDTAERIPGSRVDVVAGAGHFVWFERPGAVAAALKKLLDEAGTGSQAAAADK